MYRGHSLEKVILLGYLLIFFSSLFAQSQNNFWLGEIEHLKFQKVSEHEIEMQLYLEEYIAEGKFLNFDENEIVLLSRDSAFKGWTFVLDAVNPGKLRGYRKEYQNKELLFLSEVFIEEQQGRFEDPNLTQTVGGTNISTTRLTIVGYIPIFISLKRIDKQDTSNVVLYYTITDRIPEEEFFQTENRLELTVADFEKEKPIGRFFDTPAFDQVSSQMRWTFKRLRELPKGTFVTAIYQVKHADVDDLVKQALLLLSGLGQVNAVNDTARVVVRDRSEYVLEILELFTALDIPIPQVLIDIQILERNISASYELSTQLDYLSKGSNVKGVGLGNRPNKAPSEENISGVYSDLSNPVIKNFRLQINSEIRKGKSRLKASTRVICKNLQTASFHSGSSIPFFQLTDISNQKNDFANSVRERNSDKDNLGNTDEIIRNQSTQQSDNQNNRSWELEFLKTGVNLEVTPLVRNSKLIELRLKPSYSEITDIETSTNIPVLSDRSLDTSVTVKDGDTILVGGFLREKEIKSVTGVPLLMDIPLLGALFSTEYSSKQLTEIIFVLTIYGHDMDY